VSGVLELGETVVFGELSVLLVVPPAAVVSVLVGDTQLGDDSLVLVDIGDDVPPAAVSVVPAAVPPDVARAVGDPDDGVDSPEGAAPEVPTAGVMAGETASCGAQGVDVALPGATVPVAPFEGWASAPGLDVAQAQTSGKPTRVAPETLRMRRNMRPA
jgi:hypothetical protein